MADDRPLLVVAAEHDVAAAAFAERHRGAGVRLLRPADLSRAGWSYRVGAPAESLAVIEGRPCAARSIRGVLTRLPAVGSGDLPHVAVEDRDYVAAEMSAFLLAWLSALPCPVLNRPLAPSLSGPGWRWPQWARLAAGLGIPVLAARRETGCGDVPAATAPLLRLDLVDAMIVGARQPRLAEHARRLAQAAGVALLGVLFDGEGDAARLAGVDPWVDIDDPAVAAAVLERLH